MTDAVIAATGDDGDRTDGGAGTGGGDRTDGGRWSRWWVRTTIRLRLLDPGRVALHGAVRTIIAALLALLVTDALCRSANLPSGMVVVATVVAVLVSRSLHAATLAHRLTALVYVPVIGVAAAFTGRFMLHHTWSGAALFVSAVWASRYLMRFGGRTRRLGRLALTPLIAVLVTPIPPSAAQATGPQWGGVAGLIAVACVLAVQTALPTRPAREAAAAARDFLLTATHLPTPRALHHIALTLDTRLSATTFPRTRPPTADQPVGYGASGAAGKPIATAPPVDGYGAFGAGRAPSGARGTARPATEDQPVGYVGPGAAGKPIATAPPADGYGASGAAGKPIATGDRAAGYGAPEASGKARAAGRAGRAGRPEATAASATATPSAHAAGALADAVLRAEVLAADPAAEPGELASALASVREHAEAVRRTPSRERPAAEPPPAPRRRTPGGPALQPQTRLSAQLAAAMAAAFAVGHLLFPHRWSWPVITAFVVCSAARGRGDVVHRSGLRVAGAFAGALTGTLVAHAVAGHSAAAVAIILSYLLIGLWLRDVTYAAWAFCVTSLLAVLYGPGGDSGSALLLQRPEGILVGSACGIAAAYFVLPLRTETVLRGRTARALAALQDLLAAAREERPHPAELRSLSRRLDRAVRDLTTAAAPARAHRALLHHPLLQRSSPRHLFPRRALSWSFPVRRRYAVSPPGPQEKSGAAGADQRPADRTRSPHTADWADTLATCAQAARALATAAPAELSALRPQLGLTARNLGHVRRRLGLRPDVEPPHPLPSGPAHLVRLNTVLARLYDQLPAPATFPPTPPAPPAPPARPAPPAPPARPAPPAPEPAAG